MRISDWSSDVCSSDLVEVVTRHVRQTPAPAIGREIGLFIGYAERGGVAPAEARDDVRRHPIHHRMIGEVRARKIGRASCRERVCEYVEISVVAVELQKK